MPQIDNDVYNRNAHGWWDENNFLYSINAMLNRGRFGYFRKVLTNELRLDPKGLKTLDIGCGGGFLSEEFARLGCQVTGIDPSLPTLDTAIEHAAAQGLSIDYRHGSGEALPFESGSFDLVYCCDVLEHVSDLSKVIEETARVLKPGGVYLYDTINRTRRSNLVMIKLLQDWPLTRMLPKDVHVWEMFIKPEELLALFQQHDLDNRDLAGLSPAGNPLAAARTWVAHKLGRASYGDFGKHLRMRASNDLSISYMGWAVKR